MAKQESKSPEYHHLEKIAALLPGVRGYLQKEKARDSDQKLRAYISDQVTKIKDQIHSLQESRVDENVLDGLDRLERICRKLDQIRDSLRYAARGYSGIFDGTKVRKTELDKLNQFDLDIAKTVAKLAVNVEIELEQIGPFGDIRTAIAPMQKETDNLLELIGNRKHLIDKPVE